MPWDDRGQGTIMFDPNPCRNIPSPKPGWEIPPSPHASVAVGLKSQTLRIS